MVSIHPERGPHPDDAPATPTRRDRRRMPGGPPSSPPGTPQPGAAPSSPAPPTPAWAVDTALAGRAPSALAHDATGATGSPPGSPTHGPNGRHLDSRRADRAPARPVWQRLPRRRSIGPVPLAPLIGLQLLALAALAAWRWHAEPRWAVPAYGVAAVLALVGVALLVPVGGEPLAGWLRRRMSFVTTPKVQGAATEAGPGTEPAATHMVVRAAFPDLRVRQVRDARGLGFGVAETGGCLSAVVTVAGAVVEREARVPLAGIWRRVRAAGIPPEAITVVSTTAGSDVPGARPPWGTCHVGVRLRPLTARAAVAARGDGTRGAVACLATLVGIVVTETRAAGLHAEPVDADRLHDVLSDLLEPEAGSTGRPAWVQSWSGATGPVWSHRTQVVTRGAPERVAQTLLDTVTGADGALTVTVETRPGAGDTTLVRVLTRASGRRAGDLDRVTRGLGRASGVTLRTATGAQLDALRATTPLGAGRSPGAPGRPARETVPAMVLETVPETVLETWWACDDGHLDGLVPVGGGVGVEVGHGRDGMPLRLRLVGARPRTVVAVGEGWLASALVARAAAAGAGVVVETRQPAPWQALGASLPPGADLVVAAPGGGRPLLGSRDPARRPVLLVEDVVSAPDAGLTPHTWETVLRVVPHLAPEVEPTLAGADVVLVAPGAGDPEQLARALGMPAAAPSLLPGAAPDGTAAPDVAVVNQELDHGRVTVVRADPHH